MSGPSKYDDLVRAITTDTDADAVVLLIVGGRPGDGCCVSVDARNDVEAMNALLVRRLRTLADNIERGTRPARLAPKVQPS